MKKVLLYIAIAILVLVLGGLLAVYRSVVCIQLPHGAVMHVLPAWKSSRVHSAVILCPGGGFGFQESWREGYMWFPFFFLQGYTVALLEYRLPNHDVRVPMTDGEDAVKVMKEHADEWNYAKDGVGMMGFSAGGHVTSFLMVNDSVAARPDFAILFYPVISMQDGLAHEGTRNNLLGEHPSASLKDYYSNELHVSGNTPPAYIVVCTDDSIVSPRNAWCFYDAMRAKSRPVTLREYPTGGHGWGYRLTFAHHRQMVRDLAEWLENYQQQKDDH